LRPGQIFDWSKEDFILSDVPAAITVSATDVLTGGGTSLHGRVLNLEDLAEGEDRTASWLDDLALWAENNRSRLDLRSSVVSVSAPELAADNLLSVAAAADRAGIAATTLRAYLSRGENDVPHPQTTVGGRNMWSKPVIDDWVESRRRSREGLQKVLATVALDTGNLVTPAIADMYKRFQKSFSRYLWAEASIRKRWALRWRTPSAVHEVVDLLAQDAAVSASKLLPITEINYTLMYAILGELCETLTRRMLYPQESDPCIHRDFAGFPKYVDHLLRWLIRQDFSAAMHCVAAVVPHSMHLNMNPLTTPIPIDYVKNSVVNAIRFGDDLTVDERDRFLELAFPAKPLACTAEHCVEPVRFAREAE
jgi:hypothetical protein